MKIPFYVTLALLLFLVSFPAYTQIISAVAAGNWSDAASWVGGVVPTANDDVVLAAGHVITIDIATAACKNIWLDGSTQFPLTVTTPVGIAVYGSITVDTTGKFVTVSAGTTVGTNRSSVKIYGDITVYPGAQFDMIKKGSGTSDMSIASVEFAGSTNSNIYLTQTNYGSSKEEFNAITINKTGGAKVILKSGNLFMGDLPSPTTTTNILTFVSGMIEVQSDTSSWIILNSNDGCIVGASNSRYINGGLGKGLIGNTTTSKTFPVGDANGYRPVFVRQTIGAAASNRYPYITARSMYGNPWKDSSTVSLDIDKISRVRYFRLAYRSAGAAAIGVTIDSIGISYGAGDGVAAGNQNLRVARTFGDSMKTWTGISQTTPHTTSLAAAPTMIIADQIVPGDSLKENRPMYVALACKTGTTENTLVSGGSSVKRKDGIPTSWALSQNFPNPFNPTTNIEFQISHSEFVSLKIFDVLGREVAVLANEANPPGAYQVSWNAVQFPSGVYFYRLQAGNFTQTRRMILSK
jgi:hypothetical protein